MSKRSHYLFSNCQAAWFFITRECVLYVWVLEHMFYWLNVLCFETGCDEVYLLSWPLTFLMHQLLFIIYYHPILGSYILQSIFISSLMYSWMYSTSSMVNKVIVVAASLVVRATRPKHHRITGQIKVDDHCNNACNSLAFFSFFFIKYYYVCLALIFCNYLILPNKINWMPFRLS